MDKEILVTATEIAFFLFLFVRELAEFYESHDEGTATFGKPRDLTLISAAGMAHPTKGGGMNRLAS